MARDARGIRKSLGGDVFKVSWVILGGNEAPMIGRVRSSTVAAPDGSDAGSDEHSACKDTCFEGFARCISLRMC